MLALPGLLEAELTEQLAYIADWGGGLVFPLPNLHAATATLENNRRKTQ